MVVPDGAQIHPSRLNHVNSLPHALTSRSLGALLLSLTAICWAFGLEHASPISTQDRLCVLCYV